MRRPAEYKDHVWAWDFLFELVWLGVAMVWERRQRAASTGEATFDATSTGTADLDVVGGNGKDTLALLVTDDSGDTSTLAGLTATVDGGQGADWADVPDGGLHERPARLVPCDDLGAPGDVDTPEDLPQEQASDRRPTPGGW